MLEMQALHLLLLGKKEERKKGGKKVNHGRGRVRKRAMSVQAAEKHCGHLQCDESPVGNTHT